MLIDDIFFYFLIAAGVILSLPALWLLMRARWPHRFEKLRMVAARRVWVSFLAGLVPLAFTVGLVTLLIQRAKRGDIVGVAGSMLVSGIMITWALAGLSGLATLVGERLVPNGASSDPWKTTLRGGIVLVCLFCMPFVGWFALLPVSIITGAGMMTRSFFLRVKSEVPVATEQCATSPLPPPMAEAAPQL